MINNMNYFKKKLKVYYIIFNFQVIIGYQNNKWYVRNFNKSQNIIILQQNAIDFGFISN